jgi:hypothetical protein
MQEGTARQCGGLEPKLKQKANISKVAVAECQDLLKRLFDALAEEEEELEQLRTQVAAVTERRNGISAHIASSQNRLQQLRGNHSASLAAKSELREAVRNHQPTYQRPEEQDIKGCGHVPCDQRSPKVTEKEEDRHVNVRAPMEEGHTSVCCGWCRNCL